MTSPKQTDKPIILYTTPEGAVKVKLLYEGESLWLTQDGIAQLFGVGKAAISKHLKNIFAEGELSPETTVSKMETVVNRGFRGEVNDLIDFYNLDAIIAVGYRVNSKQATKFRIWATQTLREFIIKGFVLDHDMLKNGRAFGMDYFVMSFWSKFVKFVPPNVVHTRKSRISLNNVALITRLIQTMPVSSSHLSKTNYIMPLQEKLQRKSSTIVQMHNCQLWD